MRFREYHRADIEAMYRLDMLCFAKPFRFDRLTMQQFAEEPGAISVLVEANDSAQLVAFLLLHLEGGPDNLSAYIVTIDVSPAHRREGIGAAMLERAEASARSSDANQVRLHVAVGNVSAIAFYERQNYRRAGVARLFYREAGQDAVLFTKAL